MATMSLPHLVFTTELAAVGEGSVAGLHPVKTIAARTEQQRAAVGQDGSWEAPRCALRRDDGRKGSILISGGKVGVGARFMDKLMTVWFTAQRTTRSVAIPNASVAAK
jgi:hypothetical protein